MLLESFYPVKVIFMIKKYSLEWYINRLNINIITPTDEEHLNRVWLETLENQAIICTTIPDFMLIPSKKQSEYTSNTAKESHGII